MRVLVAICAVLWVIIATMPVSPHPGKDGRFLHVDDPCIVTYPQYRELIHDGEVTVEQCGLSVHLVKSELGWLYLQELGIMVRAE